MFFFLKVVAFLAPMALIYYPPLHTHAEDERMQRLRKYLYAGIFLQVLVLLGLLFFAPFRT